MNHGLGVGAVAAIRPDVAAVRPRRSKGSRQMQRAAGTNGAASAPVLGGAPQHQSPSIGLASRLHLGAPLLPSVGTGLCMTFIQGQPTETQQMHDYERPLPPHGAEGNIGASHVEEQTMDQPTQSRCATTHSCLPSMSSGGHHNHHFLDSTVVAVKWLSGHLCQDATAAAARGLPESTATPLPSMPPAEPHGANEPGHENDRRQHSLPSLVANDRGDGSATSGEDMLAEERASERTLERGLERGLERAAEPLAHLRAQPKASRAHAQGGLPSAHAKLEHGGLPTSSPSRRPEAARAAERGSHCHERSSHDEGGGIAALPSVPVHPVGEHHAHPGRGSQSPGALPSMSPASTSPAHPSPAPVATRLGADHPAALLQQHGHALLAAADQGAVKREWAPLPATTETAAGRSTSRGRLSTRQGFTSQGLPSGGLPGSSWPNGSLPSGSLPSGGLTGAGGEDLVYTYSEEMHLYIMGLEAQATRHLYFDCPYNLQPSQAGGRHDPGRLDGVRRGAPRTQSIPRRIDEDFIKTLRDCEEGSVGGAHWKDAEIGMAEYEARFFEQVRVLKEIGALSEPRIRAAFVTLSGQYGFDQRNLPALFGAQAAPRDASPGGPRRGGQRSRGQRPRREEDTCEVEGGGRSQATEQELRAPRSGQAGAGSHHAAKGGARGPGLGASRDADGRLSVSEFPPSRALRDDGSGEEQLACTRSMPALRSASGVAAASMAQASASSGSGGFSRTGSERLPASSGEGRALGAHASLGGGSEARQRRERPVHSSKRGEALSSLPPCGWACGGQGPLGESAVSVMVAAESRVAERVPARLLSLGGPHSGSMGCAGDGFLA